MQLDELKKSMSTLDRVLEKNSSEININISASQTAQTKILKNYRRNIINCIILALVFGLVPIGNELSFPTYLRYFAAIYLAAYAIWYTFLFSKLKNLNIASLTPSKLFAETTSVKMMTLTGEIISVITLAVFFALFLSNLLIYNQFSFWLCMATIIIGVTLSLIFYVPRYIKLFHDLNTLR